MEQSYFKVELNGLTHALYDYIYDNKESKIKADNAAWDEAVRLKQEHPKLDVTVRHVVNVVTEVKVK